MAVRVQVPPYLQRGQSFKLCLFFYHPFIDRRIIMPRKITDACVSCGTCQSECPVEAISQGATQYVIDATKCVDCGACEGACPMSAITAE